MPRSRLLACPPRNPVEAKVIEQALDITSKALLELEYQAVRAYTLNEWGELASHERLFNPPVLDLKARHSVVFIFSVIYILYCFYLSCSTSYLGVVGGWGCSVRGRTSYFFIFYSFLTFLLFGGLCSLQAPVYKFLSEGRPLWSPFFNPF